MSRILAICHSAGDAQAIINVAIVLASRGVSTTILPVGKVAAYNVKKALNPQTEMITMFDMDTICESKPIANTSLQLSSMELETLSTALTTNTLNGILVGSPSYTHPDQQCLIPSQLLEKLSPLPSAVFSDYAFFEPHHSLNRLRWFESATRFLVPFKKAIQAFKADPEKTAVVGHPSIDAAKNKFAQWFLDEEKTQLLLGDKLRGINLNPEQSFVFVATGKAGDEVFISNLVHAVSQVPNIKVYIGLHPGAESTYVEKLQAIVINHDAIKIIPKDVIDTDEMVFLSKGVISISSTVSTTAAACGKLAAYFQEGKDPQDETVPYIVAEENGAQFYNQRDQLILFLKAALASPSQSTQSSQYKVGTTASERIADEMMSLMRQKC